MAMVPIPLADQSNEGRDFRDGSGRLINCYVEPRGKEGRHAAPVYPVDGLRAWTQLPVPVSSSEPDGSILLETGDLYDEGDNLLNEDGGEFLLEGDPFINQLENPTYGVQVILEDRGSLWVITGNGVYKVSSGGVATFIGGIAVSSAVTADKNRVNQIGIVSDGYYYVLDTVTETLTGYTDQLTFSPNSVCHYNGYMVVTYSNGAFQHSGLNDATTFSINDVGIAQYRGDGAFRALVMGLDLIVFGSESIEFWQDVGNTNAFTYSRLGGLEIGISAPLSAVNVGETICWIDEDYEVQMLMGYQAKPVGNPYVARKIREAASPETIRGLSYSRDGHTFYSISTTEFTLTYNMATNLWHEEKSYGLNRRRAACATRWGKTIYAGDYIDAQIFTIDRDYHRDLTTPLVMEVITPPVHMWPEKVRFRTLFIDALFGTGLKPEVDETEANRMINDPQPAVGEPFDLDRSGDPLAWTASDPLTEVPPDSIGTDEEEPKLMVYVSEDGGENFVFLEELSLGDINSKYEELRVQGIGTSGQNGFVFRFVCSSPVVRGILGAHADVTKVRA